MAEVRKPSDLPSATKDEPMGSDEDDEERQTEPGTSATTQPVIPVLRLHPGPAASSQGPAASAISGDEHSEYSDEYSARSQDSRRTVLYPDLDVLTSDEHWTVTPETHKYAAAAGSFCFVTTERGEQQDICNLDTLPCVQWSLFLDVVINDHRNTRVNVVRGVNCQIGDMLLERCVATCGKAAGATTNIRSPARKEASVQEVRGHYKQFAETKHHEYKSSVDNWGF